MNEPRTQKPSNKHEIPFLDAYLLVLVIQLPIWLCAGLFWAGSMVVFTGSTLVGALIGGICWGFFMWVLVGNLLSLGVAWRRSSELPASDRAAFRTALERVCGKLRLIILTESADEVVLGPKRVLVRFRLQETRVSFSDGVAVLSASAIFFGRIRKALGRELNKTIG